MIGQTLFVLALVFSAACINLNGFLTVIGQKQGKIKGDVIQKGLEGTIAVSGFDSSASIPVDVVTGNSAGKRHYNPFEIQKSVDQSSPRLLNAFVTNELLKTVELQFFDVAQRAGGVQEFYRITLQDAFITSFRQFENNGALNEVITLNFHKITWEIINGGLIATDSLV